MRERLAKTGAHFTKLGLFVLCAPVGSGASLSVPPPPTLGGEGF